ncbi:MAG: hypothetical protein HETSPECPRED_005796 [Heterodermia speciosa]|uniref:Apple domain-containing protein n=1 Tax=Heterodermia speciosa TaxID=116794 RepID=A0A8H3FHI0_9LECA|nr:MAG: hypothetical protein HETSPECPRED_005796 [Heterodermia speciosa]
MGSLYIAAEKQAPFTIHCKTDYPGSDMLGVWVFTFADCMEACATYNVLRKTPPCYAVTYKFGTSDTEQGGQGNCWLKESDNVAARSKNTTDSGVFNFEKSFNQVQFLRSNMATSQRRRAVTTGPLKRIYNRDTQTSKARALLPPEDATSQLVA